MGHQMLHLLLSIVSVVATDSLPSSHEETNAQILEKNVRDDPVQNETLCPSMFMPVGNTCLSFVVLVQDIRAASKQLCHSLGGELVAIKTANKLQNIMEEIERRELTHTDFWIDGTFDGTSWNFSNGEPVPLGTPFWYATESEFRPNNDTAASCASITPDSGFLTKDVSCEEKYSPICEHEPIALNQPKEGQETVKDQESGNISCPPFFVDLSGCCIAFITWFSASWTTAKETCVLFAPEASLFLPTDIELLRTIYLYLHEEEIDGSSFWIAATDEGHEGVWKDTEGNIIEIKAPFWGNSDKEGFTLEPDGNSTENCLALTAEGQHYFRDRDCSLSYNLLCISPSFIN
ncbi:macrophage mannose receptor 1-like [Macrobrachium rosenbergii]|uniref:macrophage mannose receptor 1-like n=1 Tax=Macrobrachium rosenbergii TaxID=79674 RepID=UPI0034D6B0D2